MRLKFLGVELEEEGAESCRLDRFRCGLKHANANFILLHFFKSMSPTELRTLVLFLFSKAKDSIKL